MMYIMTGHGECTIGDETHKIGPDTLMICPAGIPHDIRNHGDEPKGGRPDQSRHWDERRFDKSDAVICSQRTRDLGSVLLDAR